MNFPQHPPHPEHATMRLTLDVDRIPGDRVAAIVEEIRRSSSDAVAVTGLAFEPVSFELAGTGVSLERLRMVVEEGGLRRALGSWRPTASTVARSPRPCPHRVPRVLLVDGDHARAREGADILARVDLHACVVGSIETAQIMMQRSELRFDAVVLHHRLADGEGLELLDRVDVARRRCSVLVIDDQPCPESARAYRVRGVYRYIAPPSGALQLASRVLATMHDTWAWRLAEEVVHEADQPPRQLVDPELAADRLQHVCGLSPLERDVAAMVLMGVRDLEIAERIGQSERTAKRHVGRVLDKAGIENRASLWSVLHMDGLGPVPSVPAEVRAPVLVAEVRPLLPSQAPQRPAAPMVQMQSSWTAL